MIIITINYSCIPGSNRNHQARTVRGACIDHPTREYPQFKQDISIEYAAACGIPQVFVATKSFFLPVIVASIRGASRFLHTGLSTAALESAVNSLALAALSTETVCRLSAHSANPQVVALNLCLERARGGHFFGQQGAANVVY
jgi:hypothetical protein